MAPFYFTVMSWNKKKPCQVGDVIKVSIRYEME